MIDRGAGMLVLAAGIEPALDYSKQILSLARLPIPPREHYPPRNAPSGQMQRP